MRIIQTAVLLIAAMIATGALAENIWDLQAVDATGLGTHPKVGASVSDPGNRVVIEGIALNNTAEYLNTASSWQIYVQAESPDKGGIAAWAGTFYRNTPWPRYPLDINAGDRVRIEGFLMNTRGKVNINERHSPDPSVVFTVTKIASGVGMPAPQIINNLSDCNYFDQTRAGGGEKYQAQWVKLNRVHIISGTWGNDKDLILADDDGSTLTMRLSAMGDFDSYTAPTGNFEVTGIFDQEDLAAPYTDSYRIWVKKYSDIQVMTDVMDWNEYKK
ncbi:MAG TPA: DUF5689 domain-containing protein [Candidatus Sumerlaeota bacterium]|nr:MAG: hypothetical protein BWY12_01243 [candidate division BRC1 bacterium ADurb.Bin183]HOE64149.1 DUF5689 domain-containing protein [Candidatus Sumerlaeota bacterium]HRR30469.1 DUF5689 domain-containing protein [Candidatus Sumerlaeia bacterium]HON51065.1 DUF5689 domain-containing protein [Candidatus Sumerlaeota bacterium]HOR65056.1 DUF5689 domain-containing protein [Candidatus Sumerlaeota bacterium]